MTWPLWTAAAVRIAGFCETYPIGTRHISHCHIGRGHRRRIIEHERDLGAAAFSIPHPQLGEDVAAAVVLHPSMTVTSDELRRYLQDQLASFKISRRIDIRDKLPKGKTGKVVRRLLTKAFEEEVGQQISVAAPQSDENSSVDSILVLQLKELWERLLQIKPVSLDHDFLEKGGDSLLAMEMLAEVERLTGQTIPTSILFEARTIRQLAQKLFELDIRPKSVTQMNPSGNLTPLFLFHGDYLGGGLYAAKLASLLGRDQPLFVIAPHDVGQDPIPLSIEAIAADSLPSLLNAQPKGPYRLCGYCLGGIIAFEVARLLISAGKKVEVVGMIDSPTVSGRRSVQLLLSAMRRARPIAGPIVDRALRRTWYICSQLDRPLTVLPSWLGNVFTWHHDERPGSIVALSAYSPKPLAVPVIYFAAEYVSAAWQRISSDIDEIKMPVDEAKDPHAEVVRNPASLAEIAYHLRAPL